MKDLKELARLAINAVRLGHVVREIDNVYTGQAISIEGVVIYSEDNTYKVATPLEYYGFEPPAIEEHDLIEVAEVESAEEAIAESIALIIGGRVKYNKEVASIDRQLELDKWLEEKI